MIMRRRIELDHRVPEKGLTEKDIPMIAEEVRKALQRDPALHDFSELKKTLPLSEGPNYRATVFYQYSLSTSS